MRPHVRMDSDSWCSPPCIADPLEEFFGGPVDCDPCSNKNSIIRALETYKIGGLHLPWRKTDYENPPYSRTPIWTDKAVKEILIDNVSELVRLVMVATSTAWWGTQCGIVPVILKGKERFAPNPRILFTRRLKFIGDKTFGARFDTALVYYGRRERAFDKAFAGITRWTSYGRATRKAS